MVKFTSSQKADRKVEQDLKKIIPIMVKRLRPVSILMFGGFGRGEGSFEIAKGKVITLNDYDMYAITNKKVPENVIEEVGIECSRAIGRGGGEFVSKYNDVYNKHAYFHVDLRALTLNELKHLHRINRTHELKYGSLVVYGQDVRKLIRDITIPTSEAFRYLINPACHLLLVMDSRRLKGQFKQDEKFYVLHHIIKAYLACASSLIISAGSFKANYTDTNKEFQRLYKKKFPALAQRIDEATKLKVIPRKELPFNDLKKRWFQARDDLLFCLSYVARQHLNIKTQDPQELTRQLYSRLPFTYFGQYLPEKLLFLAPVAFPGQYMFNILYFRRTHYVKALLDWRDVGLRIFMAALLLLYATDDTRFIEPAYSYIRTFAPVKSKKWEDLRKSLLYGFDGYFSQKII